MKFFLTTLSIVFSVCLNAQSFFESPDRSGGADYMYFGIGHQTNSISNAYWENGEGKNDIASGINHSFAWEQYEEDGWMKFEGSLLFTAVVSAVGKYDGLALNKYNEGKTDLDYRYFMLNDKFIHATGGGTIKNSGIGPIFSLGWEGVGLLRIRGKKGGELNDGIGEGNIGLISMGSGINILNPLKFLNSHSRLTFSYDWFLNRKSDDKFWFGGINRGRISVELSAVLARRFTCSAGFSYFNFKNAYNAQNLLTFEDNFIDAKITTIRIGVAYNLLARE